MKKWIFIIGTAVICTLSYGQKEDKFHAELNGQVIGWTNLSYRGSVINQWGGRFIPELEAGYPINEKWNLDAELSVNSWGSIIFRKNEDDATGDINLYRGWVRLSSTRFELRAGLQKINFGSASLLRPLMWFDRVDPRDPLRLTTGVYGLLSRYYFQNNTNVWLWGLYGNHEPKGWDVMGTREKKPEFGGRIQTPLGSGEIAFSYHHRRAENDLIHMPVSYGENRAGIDGKWDAGVGIWFEYVLKHRDTRELLQPWTNYLTVGLDYTFALGNGLNLIAEQFYSQTSGEFLKNGDSGTLSALSASYPLGLLDNISTIFYYDWKNDGLYRFINWKRTYDKFSFYMMAYWNPDNFGIYPGMDDVNLFSGKGIQLMLVFNY